MQAARLAPAAMQRLQRRSSSRPNCGVATAVAASCRRRTTSTANSNSSILQRQTAALASGCRRRPLPAVVLALHPERGLEPAGGADDATPKQQLEVCTSNGGRLRLPIAPGTTTGEIRQMVAAETGTTADKVRLAYGGLELPSAQDGLPLRLKQGNLLLHTGPLGQAFAAEKSGPAAGGQDNSAPTPGSADKQVQLSVFTMEGQAHKLALPPAGTTVGAIRQLVAKLTGYSIGESRLMYGGRELNPEDDKQIFVAKPGVSVMHAMKRMRGGAGTATSSYSSSRSIAAASAAPRRLGPAVTAPGGRAGIPAEVQLAKQFRDLLRHPIAGISAAPDEQDVLRWHVRLAGPPGSPYEGGWFDVQLQFGRGFPGQQPTATFKTRIWHPNVHASTGDVCVSLGSPDGVCSVACVLCGLQMLLAHPNPDSPLNSESASEMRSNMLQFRSKAQSMTAEHAMG